MEVNGLKLDSREAARRTPGEVTLYFRMTPEIMAELAFQQVNLIASRLTLTGQRDFYAKIQKYISEIQ